MLIDTEELIKRIEYSSNWNEPCPEWVYNLINATGKLQEKEKKNEEIT